MDVGAVCVLVEDIPCVSATLAQDVFDEFGYEHHTMAAIGFSTVVRDVAGSTKNFPGEVLHASRHVESSHMRYERAFDAALNASCLLFRTGRFDRKFELFPTFRREPSHKTQAPT